PLLKGFSIDPARRAIRLAALDRSRSIAALRRTVNETVAAVEKAYWTLVAARHDVEVRGNNVALALEQRSDTQSRIEAGPLPELAEAEETLKRQQIELVYAKDQLRPSVDLVASYARRGLSGRMNPDAVGIGGLPPTAPEPLLGSFGRSLGTVWENRFPAASLG